MCLLGHPISGPLRLSVHPSVGSLAKWTGIYAHVLRADNAFGAAVQWWVGCKWYQLMLYPYRWCRSDNNDSLHVHPSVRPSIHLSKCSLTMFIQLPQESLNICYFHLIKNLWFLWRSIILVQTVAFAAVALVDNVWEYYVHSSDQRPIGIFDAVCRAIGLHL